MKHKMFYAWLMMVFFAADYLGIQQKLPLCRSRNVFLKIIGIVLAEAIIMGVMMFIMVGIEAVFLVPS